MTTGCAGKTASVSGSVKFKGELLPSGTITFLGQAGEKKVVAADIKDGKYSIPNLTPGPYIVTFFTTAPSKGGSPPGGKAIVDPNAAANPTGKYVPIPARYATPDKSGVTYDVQAGAQTKDFDLTP